MEDYESNEEYENNERDGTHGTHHCYNTQLVNPSSILGVLQLCGDNCC